MNPEKRSTNFTLVYSSVLIFYILATPHRGSCTPTMYTRILSGSLHGDDRNWNLAIGKIDEDNNFKIMCGGVMTRSGQIISSASCLDENHLVDDQDVVQVRDPTNGIYNLTSMFLHPNYTESSNADDIAVLTITPRALITDRNPVEYHRFEINEILSYTESQFITDFVLSLPDGSTKENTESLVLRSRLEMVEIEIPKFCQKKYETFMNITGMDYNATFPRGIKSSVFCARITDFPDCEYQRGQQLVVKMLGANNRTLYYLLGTRTKDQLPGSRICESGALPMIFTNVILYEDWVASLIGHEA